MRQENEDKNDDDPHDARSVKSYTWVHTGSEDIEVYQDVIARRGDLASWKSECGMTQTLSISLFL